jgi:hypothetical protein
MADLAGNGRGEVGCIEPRPHDHSLAAADERLGAVPDPDCPTCEGERYDITYRGAPAEDGGPGPCPTCNGSGKRVPRPPMPVDEWGDENGDDVSEITERRDDERDGDAVVVEMEGPTITRCQSRFSWNVRCVKEPHGPDDPWHRNGPVHWHTDAEAAPL